MQECPQVPAPPLSIPLNLLHHTACVLLKEPDLARLGDSSGTWIDIFYLGGGTLIYGGGGAHCIL